MLETRKIHFIEVKDGYVLTAPAQFSTGITIAQDVVGANYYFRKDGWLFLDEGFWWDGASGPAIDTDTNMRASLVHDALINMVQNKVLPPTYSNKLTTDMIYFRLAREDGMFLFRAIYHLFAIQWNHWERKIKTW